MKKIILNLIMVLMVFPSLLAQEIIPIEERESYVKTHGGAPQGSYFKDISHVFEDYIGTWKGAYGGKDYELRISTELAVKSEFFKRDRLLVFYKISESITTESGRKGGHILFTNIEGRAGEIPLKALVLVFLEMIPKSMMCIIRVVYNAPNVEIVAG